MQEKGKILPLYINLDADVTKINPDESPFIKGLEITINANPENGDGINNPTNEGQNDLVLTPSRSNIPFPDTVKPAGINKNIGNFYSPTTQEFYYFNYNYEGNHGIYVIDGNTGAFSTIIVDPKLAFSDNQKHFISSHRVTLRVIYDSYNNVLEKYLMWTDGNVWQGWINVIASIKTNGFDASLNPYWSLQQPHFDREELFQWAVRPPMICAKISKIPNIDADKGTFNLLLDNAIQFGYQFTLTDGRETTVSPYSLPLITKATDFLSNPDLIPKKASLLLYAGSALVEKINIYCRKQLSAKNEINSDLVEWGDWYLYDTIYKFSNCGENANSLIGTEYWLRKNAWSDFSYDPIFNNISYLFDNSKTWQIVDQSLFDRIENKIPQLSVALSDLGDAVLLGQNRYNYDNLSCEVTNKLSIEVAENTNGNCIVPNRKIKLYAMVCRQRLDVSNNKTTLNPNDYWLSQPSYFDMEDKQMRFGGAAFDPTDPQFNYFVFDQGESKELKLDFADRNSFRVYLKGTPYYADGVLHVVNQDFTLTKVDGFLNSGLPADITFVEQVYTNQKMFVFVFELEVPAGRYNAALARHNVPNNENYRNQSTYVMGIANSRQTSITPLTIFDVQITFFFFKSVKPDAINSHSKEFELDCTNGDIDLWTADLNDPLRKDIFYIFCPFKGETKREGNNWVLMEGYLYEKRDNLIPMELFAYDMPSNNPYYEPNGFYTDKNGFFFAYLWRVGTYANTADIKFTARIECVYPRTFDVVNNNDAHPGWKPNNFAYLTDFFTPSVYNLDRVVYKGRISDLTGQIGYSNIAVSIANGSTAITDNNGNFELIVHNGLATNRGDNVYINANGNFLLFSANCGQVPLLYYNENIVPCGLLMSQDPCTGVTLPVWQRIYPTCIRLNIVVQSQEAQSLKQNASYIEVVILADLAGRITFANKISDITVPSFLKRNNVNATYFKWALSGALALNNNPATKDLKWIAFGTSLATNYRRFVEWVGDKIAFIDNNGNETTDPGTATLIRITITSLLDANIKSNLTLLSTYQFTKNDRLRVYDDGDGNLFNTATYGDSIDVEIQGSNYNQAAINANLIVPPVNTVLPTTTTTSTTGTTAATLYVAYDSRFNKLKDKTGFWIELFTPSQNNNKLPVFEIEGFMPIINGEIAEYTGGGVAAPVYNYPTSGTLNFWDTYLLRRTINIPDVGSKFISHPFESPNITDLWGANITSVGRPNAINPNAKQLWYRDNTIRSNDFVKEGIINGLGTFLSENQKFYKGYQRGGINAIVCQLSVIFFLCENDWFVTDFNTIYTRVQGNNIVTVNLDGNLGEPHQKIGNNFGWSKQDNEALIITDKYIFWYDRKNEGFILSNYSSAKDVADLVDKDGGKHGVKSYFISKTKFVTDWNNKKDLNEQFDIVAGLDAERNNIYITFRPRRKNTNDLRSYISNRRNIDLRHQETFRFNIDSQRWIPLSNFCPESYGMIKGNATGIQLISFAAGTPYFHNTGQTFLSFYGQQTEPSFIGIFNQKPDDVKILQSLSQDYNGQIMYVDLIYDSEYNSYSYIPLNQWKIKEKEAYASVLRDMNSYLEPDINGQGLYRSTLAQGKRIFGQFFVVRFVGNFNTLGQYFEITGISSLFANSAPTKP